MLVGSARCRSCGCRRATARPRTAPAGPGNAWQGDAPGLTALHQLFLDRLLPVLSSLLDTARESGEVVADVRPYELLRAVGDLVAWTVHDPDYDVRHIVTLLLTGLRQEQPDWEQTDAD